MKYSSYLRVTSSTGARLVVQGSYEQLSDTAIRMVATSEVFTIGWQEESRVEALLASYDQKLAQFTAYEKSRSPGDVAAEGRAISRVSAYFSCEDLDAIHELRRSKLLAADKAAAC